MIPIEASQQEESHARRGIWRRKRVLFLFLIVCIAPVVYLNETLLPVYEAKATVLLEPAGESVHSLGFLAQPMAGTYISNHIEEIRSRTRGAATVQKLDRRLPLRPRADGTDSCRNPVGSRAALLSLHAAKLPPMPPTTTLKER